VHARSEEIVMTENPGSLLTVAFQAAATASEILRASPPRAFAEKSGWDLGVELAVDCAIRSRLAAETPDIGFLGEAEEQAGTPGAEWAWALGPIDVTSDFARSVPLCAVSLALLHRGQPVLGVIDAPFLQKRYHAVEGQGAYLGGKRLVAGPEAGLRDAIVAIGEYPVGHDSDRGSQLRLAARVQLAPLVHRVRMLGTAVLDLAWVAEGQRDASITLGHRPWGIAAGVIIAREAGATVVEYGGPHDVGSAVAVAVAVAGPSGLVGELGPLVQAIDTTQLAMNGT
jgi:myo-inositol-1(or 4)-monophosphatase